MSTWNNIHVNHGYDNNAYTYYPVLIVGAGESGLAMGCQLKRLLGFDQFRIFDRQSGLGGTWWINRYPGVRCDVPSPFYSFSWEPYYTAPELYPDGASIVKYLHHVAAKYQLYDKIQLNTDITEVVWSDEEQLWTCTLSHVAAGAGDLSAKDRAARVARDGHAAVYVSQEKVKAKVVVSCVGGLVEPKSWPDAIPGSQDFKGELFHAARWRTDVDLAGKDVAIIGTGCSAAQIVPSILAEPHNARSVTQLMRTPPWCVPKVSEPGGKEAFARNAPTIFKYNPWLGFLLRQSMAAGGELDWFTLFHDTKLNHRLRGSHERDMVGRMKHMAPEKYHELLTPNYGIGCKRRVFDAGWYQVMHDPRFNLTAKKLVSLTADGLKLGPGAWYPPAEAAKGDAAGAEEEIKADVIVLANGYETTTWLHPLEVRGRGNRRMHDVWEQRGGPQGYMGTAMDGFPNFFMIFGPNIATGHSSVIMQTENGVLLALKLLAPLLRGDADTVEVLEAAERDYTARVQSELKRTVFSSGGCGSWYIDPRTGWNATVYPRSQIDYWWRCKFPKWSHWSYGYTRKGQAKRNLRRAVRVGLLAAALIGVYRARKSGQSPVEALRMQLLGVLGITLAGLQAGLGLVQDKLAAVA